MVKKKSNKGFSSMMTEKISIKSHDLHLANDGQSGGCGCGGCGCGGGGN